MNYQVLLSEMLRATLVTLRIFFSTLVFALPLGMLVAMGRMSKYKIVSIPVKVYILLMRGTPLMLQLLFIFYGLLPAMGMVVNRVVAAQIAFALNYAAYFAEIYRGGLESIPVGQYEASRVLGFSRGQTFFRIVLPQVVKRILPPMGNEFITLVKDTSLAQIIAVQELLKVTSDWANSAVNMVPFAIAALFYLVMNGIVTQCFNLAEKRLGYYR
jgi:polar amino acid transport system permease protein